MDLFDLTLQTEGHREASGEHLLSLIPDDFEYFELQVLDQFIKGDGNDKFLKA